MDIIIDGMWTVFAAAYTIVRFVVESTLYLIGVVIGIIIVYIIITIALIIIGAFQAMYLYYKNHADGGIVKHMVAKFMEGYRSGVEKKRKGVK